MSDRPYPANAVIIGCASDPSHNHGVVRRWWRTASLPSLGHVSIDGLPADAVLPGQGRDGLACPLAAGEFGATLMFAGSIEGRTNTMALELYAAWLAGDDGRALALVGVLSALSLGVVLVSNRLGRPSIA